MFEEFPKMARLSRDCVITEKIDGTNAQVVIATAVEPEWAERTGQDRVRLIGEHFFAVGSRTRLITPDDDNFGFARWAYDHANELIAGLGVGRHYGEWWGSGIQRGYGLTEKRFSLFNAGRWVEDWRDGCRGPIGEKQAYAPSCCSVVPILWNGAFTTDVADGKIAWLRANGSKAAPGFMKPEGIVIWHEAARQLFKKTLEKDAEGKEQKARRLAHA